MTLIPPGSRIGRFEVSGVLGEGAMGVVYLGHDPQIERPVAIKTLRPQGGGASGDELKERFLKESKLAGRLQHPNVVTIYEAGEDNGVFYIAMEYVDGDALTRFLGSRETLTLRDRVEVVREVALALQHAHSRGVLHRDVKPGNILLTRDKRVKVADFGIGKLLSGSGDMTRTGQMIGSPAYMSPEQIRGEKLDGRSDFFSLGVVFYELMTGVRPFPGDSITTLVYQILHTEPRDPLAVRSDLPPAAREVFARLLAKAPDKRPVDAPDFLRETRRIADQLVEAEQTVSFSAPVSSAAAGGAPPAAPPVGDPAAAAPSAPAGATPSGFFVSSGGNAPPSASSRGGVLYLFGVAAVLLALAIVLLVWGRSRTAADLVAAGPTPAAAAASAPIRVPTAAAPEVSPTLGPLPTAGPAGAADAVVGAPRIVSPGATSAPTRAPRAAPTAIRAAPAPASPEASAGESRAGRDHDRDRDREGSGPVPDNVYRTRRFGKFGVSPDQARMYVDGRYVGIADDWDDRGGGRKFEFHRDGTHHVRFEMPGYRDL